MGTNSHPIFDEAMKTVTYCNDCGELHTLCQCPTEDHPDPEELANDGERNTDGVFY